MNIAVVCSNYYNIKEGTANGTAIFALSYINELHKRAAGEQLAITAFASGKSKLPVTVLSIDEEPSSANAGLTESGKNVLYEQTLLAKAFSMQDEFDVYHINIGDGDIALPFSPFVKKPIVITIHHMLMTDYMRRFFSFYKHAPNVHFVSASNAQRTFLPDLQYAATIYHGIDPDRFAFSESGGEQLMWAARAIPEKGPHTVVEVAQRTGRAAKLFGIPRKEHADWLEREVAGKRHASNTPITFELGRSQEDLIGEYATSKAFLLPITYEESFGLVLIESMSCGTPVIAFARGSIPEIIEDGKTGFIVNPSNTDIRGDWLIKKTGIEGLQEAVERMYALPEDQYRKMRRACRERVEQRFTIARMTDEYLQLYRRLKQNS